MFCIFSAAGDVGCYSLSQLHFLIVYPFIAAWAMAFLVFVVAPWAYSSLGEMSFEKKTEALIPGFRAINW